MYAVDDRNLFVRNFRYDGTGPEAYFWVGDDTQPSPKGMIVPYPPTGMLSQPRHFIVLTRDNPGWTASPVLILWESAFSPGFFSPIFAKLKAF